MGERLSLLLLIAACSPQPPRDFAPDPGLIAQIRQIQIIPAEARACPGAVIHADYAASAPSVPGSLPRAKKPPRGVRRLGRPGRNRTCNPRFWRPVLYQLSYGPMSAAGSLQNPRPAWKAPLRTRSPNVPLRSALGEDRAKGCPERPPDHPPDLRERHAVHRDQFIPRAKCVEPARGAVTTDTGAPVTGVRLRLYELAADGSIACPATAIAQLDLFDASTAAAWAVHAIVTSTSGATFVDYTLTRGDAESLRVALSIPEGSRSPPQPLN